MQPVSLQPGVTKEGYVDGGRSDQSNITLDGVDINESTNDIATPVLRLNSEAIEEFRVTTTTANSSQGRSSGAQISLITRSGTNSFHGAGFWVGRRTAWKANDFFNNRSGIDRPEFKRDKFGGGIGGPIIKDRAFFFYSYERQVDAQSSTQVRVVPLPTLGQGIVRFRNTAGNIVSVNASQFASVFPALPNLGASGVLNPAALSALSAASAKYVANDFTVGDSTTTDRLNTAGYRFNAPVTRKDNSHILKLDFNINSNMQAFVRGNYIYDLSSTASQFPDTPAPGLWSHPTGFVAGHTWTISNSLVNNFRYGLTRDSFTSLGDSNTNNVFFRFVFQPNLAARDITRVTPVHNITDDLSFVSGTHTFQFGTNIRLISNKRATFANAFDTAFTNPSFYPQGAITTPLGTYLQTNFGYGISSSSASNVENAVTAVLGRFTQYSANFTFNKDGSLLPAGSPSDRTMKTEEYDFYFQDIWKIKSNLTLTAGLRYGISKPVYEANGFEVKPTVSLGELFEKRAAGAANGTPFNDLVVLDLSGPANGKTPLYNWDKNNFQPRIAMAWSPNFKDGFLGELFGTNSESVIRGGFSMTNDYYGQALAVRFDLNNTLGFSSSTQINANFYNLGNNQGPLFTGFNQAVRTLPNLTLPSGNLTFPRQAPSRNFPTAIQGGLDSDLVAPTHYSWSLTYERLLPKGLIVQASYLGRKARQLLAARDMAAPSNFKDPVSGTDWYTAASQLEVLRSQGASLASIQQIPYFANVFPATLADDLGCPGANQTQAVYSLVTTGADGCGTNYGNDWTSAQLDLSRLSTRFPGQHIFYQPQYGTYGAWSTIGKSDYNAFTLSVRQRLANKLTLDFNYTLSKSMDDGSGLLRDAVTSGAGFILNPFRQEDNYAPSDFDTRHIINASAVWQLPFGKGQAIGNTASKWLNAVVGGWQFSTIVRYNTGLPTSAPFDDSRWATNWNNQSSGTQIANIETCPDRGGTAAPKLYGCNPTAGYQSFRNALPGETGQRNSIRLPGYWVADVGLGKSFEMPWSEGHKLQFRVEAFNVANYQALGDLDGSRSGFGIGLDPKRNNLAPPSNWSNFISIQGQERIIQMLFRYSF